MKTKLIFLFAFLFIVMIVCLWLLRPVFISMFSGSKKETLTEVYSSAKMEVRAIIPHTDNIEVQMDRNVFITYITDNLGYSGDIPIMINDNQLLVQIPVADLAREYNYPDTFFVPYSQLTGVYLDIKIVMDKASRSLKVDSITIGNGSLNDQIPSNLKVGIENRVANALDGFEGTLLGFTNNVDSISLYFSKTQFDTSQGVTIKFNEAPTDVPTPAGDIDLRTSSLIMYLNESDWAIFMNTILKAGSAVELHTNTTITYANVCDFDLTKLSPSMYKGEQSIESLCLIKIVSKVENGKFVQDYIDYGNDWVNRFQASSYADFLLQVENAINLSQYLTVTRFEVQEGRVVIGVK